MSQLLTIPSRTHTEDVNQGWISVSDEREMCGAITIQPGETLQSGWMVLPDKRRMDPSRCGVSGAQLGPRGPSRQPLPTEPCVITREAVKDWMFSEAELRASPDWQMDPNTGNWVHVAITNARTETQDACKRTIEQVADTDFEPDHAIISRLRENERFLEAENEALRGLPSAWLLDVVPMTRFVEIEAENTALRARLEALCATESNHDYNGPTKDGKAVPDPAHERFHGAIGDVLAGKIIPAARQQMQEALKQAPKEATPIRPLTNTGDPRRIGWSV